MKTSWFTVSALTTVAIACSGSQFSAGSDSASGGAAGTHTGGTGAKGGASSTGGTKGGPGGDSSVTTMSGADADPTTSGGEACGSGGTAAGTSSAGTSGGGSGGATGGMPMGGIGGTTAGSAGNGGAAGVAGSGGKGGSSAGGTGSGGIGTGTPSCVTGDTACNGETCCAAILVPAGDFTLGGSVVEPTSSASVAGFRLDKYEVTVARFRRFIAAFSGPPAAGAGAHPLIDGSGWQSAWNGSLPADSAAVVAGMTTNCGSGFRTWTDAAGVNEALPINCVTWYEMFAFCAWDGGRLPTEAEWEYAASGGTEQRTYPWGNTTPTTDLANYSCLGDGTAGCKAPDILAVGSKAGGAGRWGHQDLAGNVWEYVLDFSATYPSTCNNCANVSGGGNRVQRGGSWRTDGGTLRTADHTAAATTTGADSVGARCARKP